MRVAFVVDVADLQHLDGEFGHVEGGAGVDAGVAVEEGDREEELRLEGEEGGELQVGVRVEGERVEGGVLEAGDAGLGRMSDV